MSEQSRHTQQDVEVLTLAGKDVTAKMLEEFREHKAE